MNKLFVIVGAICIMSSCTLSQKDVPTTETNTIVVSGNMENTKNSTYEKDLKDASSKIKDSEEFKSCMDMNVPMCIQNAGMQLAQKNKSTEFCNELPTPEQKESCVFAVTVIKLQETNNIELCNTLTGSYKEQCTKTSVRTSALEKGDTKICSQLEKNTGSGELSVPDTSVDECVMGVIMGKNDATIKSCDIIKSPQMKQVCTMTISNRDEMKKMENAPQN